MGAAEREVDVGGFAGGAKGVNWCLTFPGHFIYYPPSQLTVALPKIRLCKKFANNFGRDFEPQKWRAQLYMVTSWLGFIQISGAKKGVSQTCFRRLHGKNWERCKCEIRLRGDMHLAHFGIFCQLGFSFSPEELSASC